jgi:hypothetical protein
VRGETRSRSCHIVPSGSYPFDVESRNERFWGNPCVSPMQSLLYWPQPTAPRDQALPNFPRAGRDLARVTTQSGDPGARLYLIAIGRVRVAL